jgi:hypothetical protein
MIPVQEPETIPGDREADYPVNGNNTDMIILLIAFAIIFAAASRYF